MKNILFIALVFCNISLFAQEEKPKNNTNFELGKGMTFNLNEGSYQFYISGFIQPSIRYEEVKDSKANNFFNAKRSFFMLGGKALKEKVSFLVQTDFSTTSPLFDAWIAYHPYSWITITGGQKQNFTNNREMLYREDRLQFTDRSLNSRTFSRTGREFGLFVETSFKFGKNIIIEPKASLTSGDGRNSFGADSRDTDYGGLKIGGRLDLYPLGAFKDGNNLYTADLLHEDKVKILIGGAISKNKGVSHQTGEGHGEFLLYDQSGTVLLPDYAQVHADFLLKFRGFSTLLEYANTTASGINRKIFTDANASVILRPTQISDLLILGNNFTAQVGYVTKTGYSFDFRLETATPEFKDNTSSLLQEYKNYNLGFTKYFKGNDLKLQIAGSKTEIPQGKNITTAELLLQIVF